MTRDGLIEVMNRKRKNPVLKLTVKRRKIQEFLKQQRLAASSYAPPTEGRNEMTVTPINPSVSLQRQVADEVQSLADALRSNRIRAFSVVWLEDGSDDLHRYALVSLNDTTPTNFTIAGVLLQLAGEFAAEGTKDESHE